MNLTQIIVGFVITALSFVGAQGGKQAQFKRDQTIEQQKERWDACEKLKECRPLIDSLEPVDKKAVTK